MIFIFFVKYYHTGTNNILKLFYFSVTDKLLNGIAIAIIQVISPCSDGKTKEECHDEFGPFFGRMMIVFTVLSIIITVSDGYLQIVYT